MIIFKIMGLITVLNLPLLLAPLQLKNLQNTLTNSNLLLLRNLKPNIKSLKRIQNQLTNPSKTLTLHINQFKQKSHQNLLTKLKLLQPINP